MIVALAIVCLVAFVTGCALLIYAGAVYGHEPTNQRTTYHEFRYGDRRPRCRRRTRINH